MRLLGVVAAANLVVLLMVVSAIFVPICSAEKANMSAPDSAGTTPGRESASPVILNLVEGGIEILFSHHYAVDGSADMELSASVCNLTVGMTVSLHMRHAFTNITSTYGMVEAEGSVFVARVPSPVITGLYRLWVTVDNESSRIVSTPETLMTVVDATSPTIWSYGVRFEASKAIFYADCSDEYGIDSVDLSLSTDDPLRGPRRNFTLVSGTSANGSWEYSTDLDQDSHLQYSIWVSDGSNSVSTGWVSYNEEALFREMLIDMVVTVIVILLVVVVGVAAVIVALRTRAKQI